MSIHAEERTEALCKEGHDWALSFVRMISTIMIVICHLMQKYNMEGMYWFNVGVQIFLFMSGWLYGKKKIEDAVSFITKNFTKIIVSYWLYILIMIPVYYILDRDAISFGVVVKALLCSDTINGMGHLWFIPYILCCYLFTPLLYFIGEKLRPRSIFYYFGIVAGICFLIVLYGFAYHSYFISAWIICYVLGFFLSKGTTFFKIKENMYLICVTPLCLLSNGLKIYLDYFSRDLQGLVVKLYSFFRPYCHVLLGIFLFFALYSFGRVCKFCLHRWLTKILKASDLYSYQVYICHGALILSSFSLIKKEGLIPPILEITLVSTLTIFSAVILQWISSKITHKVLR